MSYETSASYADTVSMDFVKEQCPEEFIRFDNAFFSVNISFDDFCYAKALDDEYDIDITEEQDAEIDASYEALQDAFKTKTALELSIAYNEKDDRGDELDGGSFSVENVWVLSEGGRNHKDSITRLFWTNGG